MAAPESLGPALLLAGLAGATVPLGAWLGSRRQLVPSWRRAEVRHFITAFGGGALLAAVALVLVPEGAERLGDWRAVLAFGAGGLVFFVIDRALARRGGHGAQFMAMLLDYLPEAMALGAMLAGAPQTALLLAALIALQNLPESFNAWREMAESGPMHGRVVPALFVLVIPLGLLAAWLGVVHLAGAPGLLGAIMLFAAGGILYLLFEDIAPAVRLEHSWVPPLGAVAGFVLGFAGDLALGG